MAEEEPAQHDSDDEWLWLGELLSTPRSSLPRPQTATAVSSAGEAESAPGSAAHVAAGSSAGAGSAAGSLPAAGRRAPAPPSILAIRAERLQKEKRVNRQDEERQRDIWDRQVRRRRQASPEARRSGRKSSELSRERCSSRSRSPGVCERLARSETSMLSGVTWRHHIGTLNPDPELIANHARAAIRSWTGLTEAGSTLFYVGVSRYLRRRWLGGDNLSFEEAHCAKWTWLHVLSTHAHSVGDAEDALITILRREFGERRCANIRGGGGGASRCKPSLLYICGGPLDSSSPFWRSARPHLRHLGHPRQA